MLIFAHRGASGLAPENTIKAFELAIESGCYGIEFDIHEADNEFWVIHDRNLARTTNGNGYITDKRQSYLAGLDAGQGEKIPTLSALLQKVHGRCVVNIEIKSCRNFSRLIAVIEEAIKHHNFEPAQILISSFNHHWLKYIKTLTNHYFIGALTASLPINYSRFAEDISAYSVHVEMNNVSQAFVDDAHQRGLSIFVYTVNEVADMEYMKVLGVDGIFTNYPARAMALNQSC